MSVRLLRESSDTPNITNRDDARMIRYAYGGSNGVIKNFGNELSYSVSGSKFILNSGMIVLQGWEAEVNSWELDLSTVTGTQYHLVYLEVNAAAETAVIKSTYLTGSIPSLDTGNDLTQYPQGIARLPLYSFKISSKTISSVAKKFSALEYTGSQIATANSNINSLKTRMTTAEKDIDNLETRLSKLGFKQGSVVVPENTSTITLTQATNILNRQGNYVIGKYALQATPKSGSFDIEDLQNALGKFGTIPKDFLPGQDIIIPLCFSGNYSIPVVSGTSISYVPMWGSVLCDATLSASTGAITVSSVPVESGVIFTPYYIILNLGYEAKPLT